VTRGHVAHPRGAGSSPAAAPSPSSSGSAVVAGVWNCSSLRDRSALAQPTPDPILRAMRDELSRSRGLKVLSLEAPYFIEYTLEDGDSFEVSASLGGLVSVRHDRFRLPEIKVRVGDYKFDNTDYVGSGYHFGTHYDIERFPLESSYGVMRRFLWLATDSAYKSAVEAISRKRAALKNVAVNQPLDDFAKAEPLKKILEIRRIPLDEDAWTARVRNAFGHLRSLPRGENSGVELSAVQTAHYYLNSEGAEVRTPDNLIYLLVRAEAQAPDGMVLHDAVVFQSLDFDRMPADPELPSESMRWRQPDGPRRRTQRRGLFRSRAV
jgi:hypothetical protein